MATQTAMGRRRQKKNKKAEAGRWWVFDRWTFILLFALAGGYGLQHAARRHVTPDPRDTLSWQRLGMVKQAAMPVFPPDVLAQDARMVTVTGFMYPLQEGENQTRFLLSAYSASCPYCLPGGPQDTLVVEAQKPFAFTYGAVRLRGQFHVRRTAAELADGYWYGVTAAEPLAAAP